MGALEFMIYDVCVAHGCVGVCVLRLVHVNCIWHVLCRVALEAVRSVHCVYVP